MGDHYSPLLYYVQTTDVDRTKVTAQCINSGLWPPDADNKWGPLDWQPIPTNAEPLDTDNVSYTILIKPCPNSINLAFIGPKTLCPVPFRIRSSHEDA